MGITEDIHTSKQQVQDAIQEAPIPIKVTWTDLEYTVKIAKKSTKVKDTQGNNEES